MAESPNPSQPYRVLARKYRPQTFAELIGQDAMVQTLGNAIKRDRIAHAFLMTGVRGVGKTSTARLIAKALNCIGPDGQGGPTIAPCGVCEPCRAIAEGRYIDVLEIDAASNTKVDQMRDLLDNVPYAPAAARYKIYIIDEVHMLSNASFNALLKTLEEPPPHVKFIFATTEVHKVPVTVLSRCQRFDLKRVPPETLEAHFARICAEEGAEIEAEALSLIARAAEGSVRDGLSILDQAIAHAGAEAGDDRLLVTGGQVRDMLGLSDRGAIGRLLGYLLEADVAATLQAMRDQHALGVEPIAVLRGLLEAAHAIAMHKVGAPDDPALSPEERTAVAERAQAMSFGAVHRLWQLLLKGHEEVLRAPVPREACEMALLRVIHAGTMPDPGELARLLREGGVMAAGAALSATPAPVAGAGLTSAEIADEPSPPSASAPPPPPTTESQAPPPPPLASSAPPPPASAPTTQASTLPGSFAALLDLLDGKGNAILAHELYDCAALVRYAPPALEVRRTRDVGIDIVSRLGAALKAATGEPWEVRLAQSGGEPTLLEQEQAREAAAREAVLAMPVVAEAFHHFPDAELVSVDGDNERWSATG